MRLSPAISLPCFLSLAFCLSLSPRGHAQSAAPEPQAREWFNNPVFRIRDTRPVLLFFFRTNDRDLRPTLARLNRIARKADHVVIALTPDDAGEARKFIDRIRVRFTVGAGSESAEDFGVTKLPALRRIDRSDGSKLIAVEADELQAGSPQWGPYGEEDIEMLVEPTEMMDFVASDAYGRKRMEVLWKLHRAVDSAEFAKFAESQLAEENNPWVRGSLEVLIARVGTGINDLQEQPARSVLILRAYSQDPNADEWKQTREYIARLPGRSVADRVDDYRAHVGSEPNHILIRRAIVDAMGDVQDKQAARAALLELYRDEPDVAIRLSAVSKLAAVCAVGDIEAADQLLKDAATEPNNVHVRPMLEYVSYYLRTGNQDTRNMPRP